MKAHAIIKTDGEGRQVVEFYDATYAYTKKFGELGQFVSRYYLATLLEGREGLEAHGLSMYMDIPAWTLRGDQMAEFFSEVDNGADFICL